MLLNGYTCSVILNLGHAQVKGTKKVRDARTRALRSLATPSFWPADRLLPARDLEVRLALGVAETGVDETVLAEAREDAALRQFDPVEDLIVA